MQGTLGNLSPGALLASKQPQEPTDVKQQPPTPLPPKGKAWQGRAPLKAGSESLASTGGTLVCYQPGPVLCTPTSRGQSSVVLGWEPALHR